MNYFAQLVPLVIYIFTTILLAKTDEKWVGKLVNGGKQGGKVLRFSRERGVGYFYKSAGSLRA